MTDPREPVTVTLRDGAPPVLLDADTAERALRAKWQVQQTGAGSTTFTRKYRDGATVRSETLAQFVMNGKAPGGMKWQPANGDQHDYRRENLTAVPTGKGTRERALQRHGHARSDTETTSERTFVGVQRVHNRYRARILLNGTNRTLGSFATAEEAARAYDDARVAAGLSRVNFRDAKS